MTNLETISEFDLANVVGGGYGALHPLTDDEAPPSHQSWLHPADEVDTHESSLHPQPEASFTRCTGGLWHGCPIKSPQ